MSRVVTRCTVCHSTSVQEVAWIDPNANAVVDYLHDSGEFAASMGHTFCFACDEAERDPNPVLERVEVEQ